MIVYKSDKKEFIERATDKKIADAVKAEFEKKIGKVSPKEYRSWQNSLRALASVLMDSDRLPDDTPVCIEYRIPNRQNRIDFLISGRDKRKRENVVIIELKQWEDAEDTENGHTVKTFIGNGINELVHPSYQAWSYAVTLQNYNEIVQNDKILLYPCAYLHNYHVLGYDPIFDSSAYPTIESTPIFSAKDSAKLRKFIEDHIAYVDEDDIIGRIDSGKIKPSKSLQDVVASMMKGNEEFILLDEQRVAYEKILQLYRMTEINPGKKYVFIVKGGPGTGKSVIAINLLATLTKMKVGTAYVTKTTATKAVFEKKLRQDNQKGNMIANLFLGSGAFVNANKDEFGVLLVDEAHRLIEKSGFYHTLGENQIKEIINASRVSVFFIDEHQHVSAQDIGSIREIEKWAEFWNAEVYEEQLISQFRCNGSNGYIDFLDDVLEIRKSDYTYDPYDYDMRIFDDPSKMRAEIKRANMGRNKSRMIAGYCWNWVSQSKKSKDNSNKMDIVFPEYGFEAQWNFDNTNTWAIDENSVDQVGCIHTSQGLEFDYAGIIIGDDLRYENGHVITDYTKRADTDCSLNGLVGPANKARKRKRKKYDPIAEEAEKKLDAIIRDTYKTLLSRAMKGCFVYCTDKALAAHLREKLNENRRLYEDFMSIDFTAERP